MRKSRRQPTPSLGTLAHDRNRYKHKSPDFYALGQQYKNFKQYLYNVDNVNSHASLSWDNPFAVRELTKTLLLHDFGLQWDIPINRLCPPLPNRLNYLHWIEDLLGHPPLDSKFRAQEQDQKASENIVYGIDVGTGANCIYALLGATMNKWKFIATEIDAESFACAKENVARNQLESMITVKQTQTNKLLFEPLQDEPMERKFHFVMCNPPFFDNMDEADTNPASSCMGSANEMVFPGGEVAFIGNMILESVELQDRVLWYTSMVGKKASLRKVLALLREKKVRTTRTTEFCQGRTKRWGIAWTFARDMMDDPCEKVLGKRKEAHRRQQYSFRVPLKSKAENGCATINEVFLRLREFIETKEELKLSENIASQQNQEEVLQQEYQESQMYRLEQHKLDRQTSATTVVFKSWLFTKKENEGHSGQ
ncbi:unnamed protein product [Peronospora belbahrii]|uniref:U6 small nuclear RNA (adenine-(43)-N(6))-methyltransferase n=1 Tax=Peronospora belbahrii TaxID=622444 RepID=A0ABN8CLP8_9STRA|nr:unnamed protein product [Peronospora belbahrii]